tara:strand:- start:741 stop:860 length:120 start_codon:yes stop_codon:yes gene_type:complete
VEVNIQHVLELMAEDQVEVVTDNNGLVRFDSSIITNKEL